MAKEKQTEITQPKGKSWAEVVKESKDKEEIYPKLDFGPKGTESTFEVEFLEAEPRVIRFQDKMAPREEWENGNPPTVDGLAINVKLIESQERRSILMRADPTHGLTQGIANLSKTNGTLLGVLAKIEARNYTHKQWGKNTRGYSVYQIEARGTSELP